MEPVKGGALANVPAEARTAFAGKGAGYVRCLLGFKIRKHPLKTCSLCCRV